MSIFKRYISYFLILIFGLLFVKNLIPGVIDNIYSNCQEIGHIHKYSFNRIHNSSRDFIGFNKLSQTFDLKNENSCHNEKSVFNFAFRPFSLYNLNLKIYEIKFVLILSLKNHFADPYIELNKKPPKAA